MTGAGARALVLCVGYIGALVRPSLAQCPDGTPPPCNRPARATTAAPYSVAVLYFENLGRDTSDAYIADGLTEEVTSRLGQVSRLAVTSRTAVRRLRNATELPTGELGRALNAAYLVSGSVRRAGAQVRVTVELVRASSGARVWGDQFDRGTNDLLAIQEDIARQVATGIAGQLLPAERASIAARPTRNAEAYDHALRGNRILTRISPASLGPAIQEYEAALRLDPGYTKARAAIAVAYALAINWGWATPDMPAETLLARGLAASERALRENPRSPDALLARGVLLMFTRPGTFEGVLDAMRGSIALDPENAIAHNWYATALRRMGAMDSARAEYARVDEIDPAQAQALSDRGFIAMQLRRFREALRWYDSALVLDTTSWQNLSYRARLKLDLGDSAGALLDARRGAEMSGGQRLAVAALAQVEARTGNAAAARARIEPLLDSLSGTDSVLVRDGYELGLSLMALGERDHALAFLERVRPRGPWLWSYLILPGFDPVRADPRFQRIFAESRPPGAPNLP